jgi:hypothetical protein
VIIATEKINRRLVKLEGLQGLQHLPSNPDSKVGGLVKIFYNFMVVHLWSE